MGLFLLSKSRSIAPEFFILEVQDLDRQWMDPNPCLTASPKVLSFSTVTLTSYHDPHWMEQTLRAGEWNIWLQLVQRVNRAAVAASHDFDAWVFAEARHPDRRLR
jgi:hypothetical protein